MKITHFESWCFVPRDFTGAYKAGVFDIVRHCKKGMFHRLDGPAIYHEDDYLGEDDKYFVEGKEYSKEEFDNLPEVIEFRSGGKQ